MSNTMSSKVAVVTGGTSGIGLAIARRFAAEGATVFIAGRRQEAIDAATAEIDGDVTGVRADAADAADLEALYAAVRERAGRTTSSSPTPAAGRSRRSARSPRSSTTRPSTPTSRARCSLSRARCRCWSTAPR